MQRDPDGQVTGVLLDLESTGLNPHEELILEVGVLLIDRRFDIVDTLQVVISSPSTRFRIHELKKLAEKGDEGAARVVEMHTANGLFKAIEAENGLSRDEAVDQLQHFIDQHGAAGLPLTGSSVHFDRRFLQEQMPHVERLFHYRNIDVSSIREWVATYRPELFRDFVEPQRENLHPRMLHRAVSDCKDTLDELRLYTEVLL